MAKITFQNNYTTGGIEDLKILDDVNNFRWVRGSFGILLGMNYLDSKKEEESRSVLVYKYFNDLEVTVERQSDGDDLREIYSFVNKSQKDIDLSQDEYGVLLSFADGGDIPIVAVNRRAYSRVFKISDYFCVYNSRTGSQEDGVGLALTDGVLGEYKATKYSLRAVTEHTIGLPKLTLKPEESISFSWKIFYFENLQDFEKKVRECKKEYLLKEKDRLETKLKDYTARENSDLTISENASPENDQVVSDALTIARLNERIDAVTRQISSFDSNNAVFTDKDTDELNDNFAKQKLCIIQENGVRSFLPIVEQDLIFDLSSLTQDDKKSLAKKLKGQKSLVLKGVLSSSDALSESIRKRALKAVKSPKTITELNVLSRYSILKTASALDPTFSDPLSTLTPLFMAITRFPDLF